MPVYNVLPWEQFPKHFSKNIYKVSRKQTSQKIYLMQLCKVCFFMVKTTVVEDLFDAILYIKFYFVASINQYKQCDFRAHNRLLCVNYSLFKGQASLGLDAHTGRHLHAQHNKVERNRRESLVWLVIGYWLASQSNLWFVGSLSSTSQPVLRAIKKIKCWQNKPEDN